MVVSLAIPAGCGLGLERGCTLERVLCVISPLFRIHIILFLIDNLNCTCAFAQKNSITRGLPEDHSDANIIQHNFFGPGITAENIDIKEFTKNGIVKKNTFNGSSIAGINGAIAWVAIKGNNYTVVNNTGTGCMYGGQGFRVLQIHPGLAEDNKILNNSCNNFISGSYCVFVDRRVQRAQVDCSNKREGRLLGGASPSRAFTPSRRVCNCKC